MISLRKVLGVWLMALMFGLPPTLQAQTNVFPLTAPNIDPVTGGAVDVLMRMSDGRVLVGGSFERLGSQAAPGCGRLLPDGSVDSSFQCAQSNVFGFSQDSIGRIYAHRSSSVSGALVRLLADGSIDPSFAPTSPTGSIQSLLALDDAVYLAGTFSAINGVPRNRLAKLDSAGVLDPNWTPEADATVRTLLAPGDGFLYLGGGFANINQVARTGIARVVVATGALDDWNPQLTGAAVGAFPVAAMAFDGTHLYVSGAFNQAQGMSRQRLAKIGFDAAAKLDPDWAPRVLSAATTSGLKMLSTVGDAVYVGDTTPFFLRSGSDTGSGRLLRLGRHGSAALDTGFDPFTDFTGTTSNGPNSVIAGDGGGRLFVGGVISKLSLGAVRLGLAALNANGSVDGLSALTEAVDTATVASISVEPGDGSIYLQGDFLKVNGIARQGLIRLLPSNFVDGGFRPSAARYSAAALAGGAVYVADDESRLLRKLDRLTGSPAPDFTPIAYSQSVTRLETLGDHIYLFGSFVVTGTAPQLDRFARLRLDSDMIDESFVVVPNSGATVQRVALDETSNSLFVSGNFASLNGVTVSRLARIDATNLTIDGGFAPNLSAVPGGLLTDGIGGLWLSGSFSTVNGQPCRSPVRLLISTQGGLDPNFCSPFSAGNTMALAQDSAYVSGVGSIRRYRRVDGGSADPTWLIAESPFVANLTATATRIYAYGRFTSIAGETRRSAAAFLTTEEVYRDGFESP